jgi:hypothetical protein
MESQKPPHHHPACNAAQVRKMHLVVAERPLWQSQVLMLSIATPAAHDFYQ